MQNMFPLTQTWIWIPFPNRYYTHFGEGSLSQGQISIPITYISIRGSESKSEPMEKSYIVQESVSKCGNVIKSLHALNTVEKTKILVEETLFLPLTIAHLSSGCRDLKPGSCSRNVDIFLIRVSNM